MQEQHFVSVEFADGPAKAQPRRVVLRHKEFAHATATMEIEGEPSGLKRYATGAPVKITYGLRLKTETFIGYINHVEPLLRLDDQNRNAPQVLRVVCVGASWVLKQGGYDSKRSASVSQVVRDVSTVMRLDTKSVESHPQIWPVLSQAGRSYWDWMVECAQKVGYTFFVNGVEVVFQSRETALRNKRYSSPILSPRLPFRSGQILDFRNHIGLTAPIGSELAHRITHSVDPRTQRAQVWENKATTKKPLIGKAGLKPVFKQGAMTGFDSLVEARDKLTSAEIANQLPIVAEAVVRGAPTCRVGSTVFIEGVSANDNGYWYVTEAVHDLAPREYTTTLTLGRDSLDSSGELPPRSNPRTVASRGVRLLNNQWVLR